MVTVGKYTIHGWYGFCWIPWNNFHSLGISAKVLFGQVPACLLFWMRVFRAFLGQKWPVQLGNPKKKHVFSNFKNLQVKSGKNKILSCWFFWLESCKLWMFVKFCILDSLRYLIFCQDITNHPKVLVRISFRLIDLYWLRKPEALRFKMVV